jgi:deoxyribonuclease-1
MGVWRVGFGVLFLAFCSSAGASDAKDFYYGKEFALGGRKSGDVKERLHEILNSFHVPKAGNFDNITATCEAKNCYRHTAVGYKRAREFLFGKFYLVRAGKGFGVKDVYCQKVRESDEFSGEKPGPNSIPDHRVVNAEHTWPQSKFTRSFSNDDQKSDLHHLFPTDSELNSKRSSLWFGEVNRELEELKCPESKLGNDRTSGDLVFEPPQQHQGNVARAIFYFSTRYKTKLGENEENTLRKWHREDPVDAEETQRNEEIFQLQKSRNPYVDYPELVDEVADF